MDLCCLFWLNLNEIVFAPCQRFLFIVKQKKKKKVVIKGMFTFPNCNVATVFFETLPLLFAFAFRMK